MAVWITRVAYLVIGIAAILAAVNGRYVVVAWLIAIVVSIAFLARLDRGG